MPEIDFFYEFASSYSYIAAMRIAPVAKAAAVTVRWRPFLLGPIFKAQGWDTSPFNLCPAKGRYMVRDCERQCAALGLTFRLPEPFRLRRFWPRVLRWFVPSKAGARISRARSIAPSSPMAATSAIPSSLPKSCKRSVRTAPPLSRAQSDEIKGKLRSQTEEAQRLGIFGAPSFIAAGELFWGNDRLEQALDFAR